MAQMPIMDNNMKKYTIGLYEKAMPNELNWHQKLTEAKEAGYDSVEISIDESDQRLERLYNKELQVEIKKAILEVGIPIRSMCLSGHRKYPLGSHDEKIREKSLDIFYRAVDLAVYLGTSIIQLAGYDVYYEEGDQETVKWFGTNLLKGVNYAAKRGILLGFETMETPFMNSVRKAMKYVDLVNSPYLHVYPDIGNITNSALSENHDLYEDIRSGKGHLIAAHLKETIPNVFREVEFGEGHVDFEKGVKALWEEGVRFFGCEFWYSDKTDYRERLRHNIKFVREYLDKMEETK